ncbi:NAD(P)H-hydrate dehydratase [Tepidimonas sp.]|uniref:NAD(P)H-hydrate dehydratase n=1 Tax=Tepidimonas sp. TaxID=2002775 RepID=UPI002FE34F1D
MLRIDRHPHPLPLYGSRASRAIEQRAATALPTHALMQRAGVAVARLARAWQPHARDILVLAGGGNNGGDGWHAAALLHHALGPLGARIRVWFVGDADRLPDDARWARTGALAAGVESIAAPPADDLDLVIDALLGLGLSRPVEGPTADALDWLQRCPAPTLCVDVPSGLDADSGRWWSAATPRPTGPRITLTLLTIKTGLWTGAGRAACGEALWFDDLGVTPEAGDPPPDAYTAPPTGWPRVAALRAAHDSHKGARGDVLVVGGQPAAGGAGVGMVGAAVLAGRAALRGGAGRVWVALPAAADHVPALDPGAPGLMLRSVQAALDDALHTRAVVVAGCGGGAALAPWLPWLLAEAPQLVLDADALNVLASGSAGANAAPPWAQRATQDRVTVLTPHPAEAARLLGCDPATVQQQRLYAAQTLAQRWRAIVVLKGSGTIIAAPDRAPVINPSGDGLLATAGTGDLLAGLIGARLASMPTGATGEALQHAVAEAVAAHGTLTAQWDRPWAPTASDLIA